MFKGFITISLFAALCLACSPGSDSRPGGDVDDTGDDGDTGGDPPDTSGPNIEIVFPSIDAYTPKSSVTVRGRSEDPSGVVLVTANGVTAGTTDDYATWEVPGLWLAGVDDMEVFAEDLPGNSSTEYQTIDAGVRRMLAPTHMAYDAGRGRVLVMDSIWDAILSLAPDSGEVGVLLPDASSSLSPADEMVFSPGSDQLLAFDRSTQDVLGFHPETGFGTVLSGDEVGSGPLVSEGLALTPGEGTLAYVIDVEHNFSGHGVLCIELSTGDRTLISLDGLSPGPSMIEPVDMVHDTVGDRLLVLDVGIGGVISIALGSGERVLVADSGSSTEPFGWGEPFDLQLGAQGESLWLLDAQESRLWEIDLDGGSSHVASDTSDGVSLRDPLGIVLESTGSLLAVQPSWPALVRVDLATGTRTISAETRVGQGHGWVAGGCAGVCGARDELYISDQTGERLHAISLADGERAILAEGRGNGSLMSGALLDEQTLLVLATEPGQEALYAYDLESGGRQIISGQGAGWGIQLANAVDVAVDPEGNKAYVLEYSPSNPSQTGIVTVDLSSGGRTILTGGTTGTGAPLQQPTDIVWDAEGERAIVTDPGSNALVAVHPDGVRAMFAGLPVGSVNSVLLDAPEERVLCASAEGRIFSVALVDGTVLPIYDMSVALPGPPPGDVLLIGISYERELLYALSDSYQGILAIDLDNEQHVLLSLGGE